MNTLYPELKPKERIQTLIERDVFPHFKEMGYRFIKSGISLKKDTKDFTYEIWFPRNHRNMDDVVCAFDIHATIYLRNHGKWFKKVFEKKLANNVLISKHNIYIPNWDETKFQCNYDLALYDNNEILESILNNIKNAVLPFFEQATDYDNAVDLVKDSNHCYMAPVLMDLCEIQYNESKSTEILNWFQKEVDAGTDFSIETIEEVELRKQRLKKGYNKASQPTPKSGATEL